MKNPGELFKVLSVDNRVRIIELLKEKGSVCVSDMAESLGISRAAVSQHLRILRSAGLVEANRRGYWIPYSLREEVLEKYREELSKVCSCGCWGIVCPPLTGETRKGLEEYKRELERELKRVKKKLAQVGD